MTEATRIVSRVNIIVKCSLCQTITRMTFKNAQENVTNQSPTQ